MNNPFWEEDPSVLDSGRRITLSKKVFSSALRLGLWEARDIRPNGGADYLIRSLEVRLASQEVGRFEFRAPADWWQHVKERFAPAWFKTRYPVQYRVEKINVTALYPNISLRDEQEYFLYVERDLSPPDTRAVHPQ